MATVVTDLDGTLLVHGKLDEHSIAVFKALQTKHRLVLATGRDLESVKPFVQALEMERFQNGAVILLNGGELIDFQDGEHVKEPAMTKDQAKDVLKRLAHHAWQLYVVANGAHERTPSPLEPLMRCIPLRKVRNVLRHPRMQTLPETIDKIAVLGYWGTGRRVAAMERATHTRYIRIGRFWDEIVPEAWDKKNMVARYLKKHGESAKDLFVFGDGENDVRMLGLTAHSFAPRNALPAAKKAARHLFEPGVVAKIVESKILRL